MHLHIMTKEGEYDLEAGLLWIGQDLLVAIWGGERPHIGAAAVSQPRPSLKDPDVTSASSSVICLLGHKEDSMAKQIAERLAAELNTQVVVTAGIHWDNIDQQGIDKIMKNSQVLLDLILKHIRRSE